MKSFYFVLILTGVLLFSCPTEGRIVSAVPLFSIGPGDNIFLNKIKGGIDRTEGISIKLVSYKKIGVIDSNAEKEILISNILDKDNFYFFSYDSSDETFADLEMYTFDEALDSNPIFKQRFEEKLTGALESNAEFLRKNLEVKNDIYEVEWMLRDKRFNTLAIFGDQEFIYDNVISNLITFEVERIPAGETSEEMFKNHQN